MAVNPCFPRETPSHVVLEFVRSSFVDAPLPAPVELAVFSRPIHYENSQPFSLLTILQLCSKIWSTAFPVYKGKPAIVPTVAAATTTAHQCAKEHTLVRYGSPCGVRAEKMSRLRWRE
jgi:hypothetical protein